MSRASGMRFDHISLMLSNIEEGIRFFHRILGFPVLTDVRDSEKEVVVIRAGRIHIELWQRDRCSPDNRVSVNKRPLFLNHIAFEVRDLEDVVEAIRSAGYEIVDEIYVPTEGVREALVLGPDGMEVQFIEQNISKLVWRTVSGGLKRDRRTAYGSNEEIPPETSEEDKEAR